MFNFCYLFIFQSTRSKSNSVSDWNGSSVISRGKESKCMTTCSESGDTIENYVQFCALVWPLSISFDSIFMVKPMISAIGRNFKGTHIRWALQHMWLNHSYARNRYRCKGNNTLPLINTIQTNESLSPGRQANSMKENLPRSQKLTVNI